MAKRGTRADWSNLVPELLDVILEKLFHNPDYIRFGAVCKSWRLVALLQKQKRIANISKQSPIRWVLCPSDDSETYGQFLKEGFFKARSHLRLYNVGEDKSYELNLLQLLASPEDDDEINDESEVTWYGSSCGWLALQTKDLSEPIRVVNPFIRKCIKVPPVPDDNVDKRIIVCNDPTTSPDKLVIVAILNSERVAIITAGETSWTIGNIGVEEEGGTSFLHYSDIIFHKGLLYVVDHCDRLFVIDYNDTRTAGHFPTIPVVSKKARNFDISIALPLVWNYLAESSSGDLLLVQEDYKKSGYETYKLENYKKENITSHGEKEDMEEANWVKVSKFKEHDTISTDFHDTVIVPFGTTFCIPDCNPDWLLWDTSISLDEGLNGPNKDFIYPLDWLSPQLY
ncbi:OLC1v1016106C1 [Oldenlandia corymbosa var. corymbosa]|uniref:OLC1v1016106C1 n=1 Tax=Oldenlandia corymbosa var. corymbosa TaxID=529605 RepID=A0AAV1E4P1_OLDCO|nr:OLC1v1016106C1 [Oldenlandia corymbosa var. corymbosa]